MAGTVSISTGRLWSVSSGLFYWVINDIARNTSDVELAGYLRLIDRENLGWFGLDEITPGQRDEVHRIIAERLVRDAERDFTADLVARQSGLGLLKDLVAMASGAPEPMIIDLLRDEFESWQQTLPASAVAKFEECPRPGGAPRAVRITVDAPPCMAEATVWESGEADLASANVATGDLKPVEHMELTTRLGARGLLQDLARAVSS